MDPVIFLGYLLLGVGAALLLLTRWRLTRTAGIVALYFAGVALVNRMPGGTARNLTEVAQDFLGGWGAVPTIVTLIAFGVVAWGLFSGHLSVVTGLLALALPALLPYLAHGPLHGLWVWWQTSPANIWQDLQRLIGQGVKNAKPPTR